MSEFFAFLVVVGSAHIVVVLLFGGWDGLISWLLDFEDHAPSVKHGASVEHRFGVPPKSQQSKFPPRPTKAQSLERRAHRMAQMNSIPVERAREILEHLIKQAPDLDEKGQRRKEPIQAKQRRKRRRK